MKYELIILVWTSDVRDGRIEKLCDEIARNFGFEKRIAGVLPSGLPIGYVYSIGSDNFRLSLLDMASQPYAKVHVFSANSSLCSQIRDRLLLSFGSDVEIVGDSLAGGTDR